MTNALGVGELVQVLSDGREHRVSEEAFSYFLDVLPPVMWKPIMYQGKSWAFGFAEGYDHVTVFRKSGNDYYAQQTPWINPYEAGSVENQKRRWQFEWAKIGKSHPELRDHITLTGFVECDTDEKTLRCLQAETSRGLGLFVGDICFISEGGGSWLTIKGRTEIGSLPTDRITQDVIDGIRATPDAGYEAGLSR